MMGYMNHIRRPAKTNVAHYSNRTPLDNNLLRGLAQHSVFLKWFLAHYYPFNEFTSSTLVVL